MNASEVKAIRLKMSLDLKSMAIVCGMPYRTYQDYEYGNRPITERAEKMIHDAFERDKVFMAGIRQRIWDKLDGEYKGGMIPSEISPEDVE